MRKGLHSNKGGILSSLIVVVAVLSIFSVTLGTITLTQKKLANHEELLEQVQLSALSAAEYVKGNPNVIEEAYKRKNTKEQVLFEDENLGVVTYQVQGNDNAIEVGIKATKKGQAYKVKMNYEYIKSKASIQQGLSVKKEVILKDHPYQTTYTYVDEKDQFLNRNQGIDNQLVEYLVEPSGSIPTIHSFNEEIKIEIPHTKTQINQSTFVCNPTRSNNIIQQACRMNSNRFKDEVIFRSNSSTPLDIYLPSSFIVSSNGTQGKSNFIIEGNGIVNFYIYKDRYQDFLFPTISKSSGSKAMINIYSEDQLNLRIAYNRQNGGRTVGSVYGNIIAPNSTIILEGDDKNYNNQTDLYQSLIVGNVVSNQLIIDVSNHSYKDKGREVGLQFIYDQGSVELPNDYTGKQVFQFIEFK